MADDPATERTTRSKLNREKKNECAGHEQLSMFDVHVGCATHTRYRTSGTRTKREISFRLIELSNFYAMYVFVRAASLCHSGTRSICHFHSVEKKKRAMRVNVQVPVRFSSIFFPATIHHALLHPSEKLAQTVSLSISLIEYYNILSFFFRLCPATFISHSVCPHGKWIDTDRR